MDPMPFIRDPRVSFLCLLFIVAACTPANNIRDVRLNDTFQPGDTLTVMSFNIRVGYGPSKWGTDPYQLRHGPEQLEPILAAIRSVDPDVIGLQEVLSNGQARRIAKALNLNYAFSAHPARRPWWGVAVLSKYPITDARTVQISSGIGNSKNASLATVEIGGRFMLFASIHKDVDLRDGGSFRKLRSAIESFEIPTVLIGDFNAHPGDRRFQLLGNDFVDTATVVDTLNTIEARRKGTWGSGHGTRIDYVLIRQSEFHVVDGGIVPREHRGASDHYAYFAIIRPKL